MSQIISSLFVIALTGATLPATDHVLDGRFDEWTIAPAAPDDRKGLIREVRIADEPGYVHLQIDFDRECTLQGLDAELQIAFDFDGSLRTGPQGWDGMIVFSPMDSKKGTPRAGSEYRYWDQNGQMKTKRTLSDLGVVALPTHSSDRFEIRLERPEAFTGKTCRVRILSMGAQGEEDSTSILEHEFKTKAAGGPIRSKIMFDPAEKEAPNSFRTMSWNGEFGALFKTPLPFIKTFEMLKPDIVFLQELPDKTPPSKLTDWFDRLDGDLTWRASVGGSFLCVAVMTPHPYEPAPELARVMRQNGNGKESLMRATGGLIQIDGRTVLAASIHLKCCGRLASSEDDKRLREAQAVNQAMRAVIARARPDAVVIGGDLNLVGTPEVLAVLAEGLGVKGADLVIAEPMRPRGDANTTWEKDGQAFVPGRLDFILYGGSVQMGRAVVTDPSQMDERWRRRHGIPEEAPSDHLPIDVDLKFTTPPRS